MQVTSRPTWDVYFMNIAVAVSSRATCDRKSVGAVVTSSDRHILATGYNGAITGEEHCDDVGHLLENDSCQRVVHSEANAIAQVARSSSTIAERNAAIYVTASPCWPCFRLIAQAGIRRVVYGERFYRDFERIQEVARRQLIELSFCDVRRTELYQLRLPIPQDGQDDIPYFDPEPDDSR